jgi:hypothetical protein
MQNRLNRVNKPSNFQQHQPPNDNYTCHASSCAQPPHGQEWPNGLQFHGRKSFEVARKVRNWIFLPGIYLVLTFF